MIRIVQLILLLILIPSAIANAQEKLQTIELTLTDNGHAIVPLFIGDQGPFRFLIDTGSDRIVLDASLKDRAGVSVVGNASMRGAGSGPQQIEIARPIELSISKSGGESGMTFKHQQPVIMPIASALGASGKLPFDGIIGLPFFENRIVQIDFAAGEVRFLKKVPAANAGDIELPMTIERGYPFLSGSFTPLRKGQPLKPIRGKFMIDIGSFHGVMIDWPIVEKFGLLDPDDPEQIEVEAGSGVGGKIAPFRRANIANLKLNDSKIPWSHVVLRTDAGGRPPVAGRIGNIGLGFLRDYLITFDYDNEKIVLQKNQDLATIFVYEMFFAESPDEIIGTYALARQLNSNGTFSINYYSPDDLKNPTSVATYDKNGIPRSQTSSWNGMENSIEFGEREATINCQGETKTLKVSRKDLARPHLTWFWLNRPEVGFQVQELSISQNTGELNSPKTFRYVKKQSLTFSGEKISCHVVVESRKDAPKSQDTYWYDDRGMLVKQVHDVGGEKRITMLKKKVVGAQQK